MRGTPALICGEITRPLKSEAEARAEQEKHRQLLRELHQELALQKEDEENEAAEADYQAYVQQIWSER